MIILIAVISLLLVRSTEVKYTILAFFCSKNGVLILI